MSQLHTFPREKIIRKISTNTEKQEKTSINGNTIKTNFCISTITTMSVKIVLQ